MTVVSIIIIITSAVGPLLDVGLPHGPPVASIGTGGLTKDIRWVSYATLADPFENFKPV